MTTKIPLTIYINDAFRHHQAGVTIGNFSTDYTWKFKFLLAEPVETELKKLREQNDRLRRQSLDMAAYYMLREPHYHLGSGNKTAAFELATEILENQ